MGTFLVYILKSAVCLAMFYLFYRLLLSKETFHRFNRMALLGVMLLSCLLPLVKVTVEQASPVNAQVMSMEDLLLMYQWNSEAVVVEEGSRPFHWQEGLVLVYFAGLFFVIVRHLWSLGRMLYLIRHSRCERLDNGIRLVVHRRKLAPFSWMRYIVISETDLKESGHHILVHEMAHIHYHHSWDLLLAEACAWLQWFNPAIWLLKQELQNIHEYEADEEVLRQGINAKEYQMLLIKKAVGARLYSIANSFNHSMSVKDCLKKADQTIVLTESDTKKDVKVVAPAPQAVTSDDQTFSVVEQMPEYPGGMRAGLEFMARNLRYPTKAREAGKQGRVIVQFVVRKDGSLSDFKVLRPVDPWLDAEAIRVISTMPKWKPGMQDGKPVSVKFTLPVTFMLEGTNNKPKAGDNDVVVVGYGVQKSEESVDVPTIKLHNPMDELSITGDFKIDSVGSSKASGVSPLVIMDGLEVSDDVIKKLNPKKIQSVSVLKNEAATAKYGKKGKFGVILITTKRE